MKVIVVGFGRVGSRTARVLAEEGHDVTVVDNSYEKVKRARKRGFTVVEGDGSTIGVLEDAGVADADSVGAITGDLDVNHTICQLATDYGCRAVLRISQDVDPKEYARYAEDADEVIYPERLGAAGAKTALLGGDFNALGELTEDLQILVFPVPEDAPIVGDHVNAIDLGDAGRIYAHGREDESLTIPLPGTIVEPGDRIALLAESDAVDGVRATLAGD